MQLFSDEHNHIFFLKYSTLSTRSGWPWTEMSGMIAYLCDPQTALQICVILQPYLHTEKPLNCLVNKKNLQIKKKKYQ
uniref:Uncharacterized protein n=1 Tax=Anguilla anguilla TaxID=7936 RepID=A0A0E9TA32_ANGAN